MVVAAGDSTIGVLDRFVVAAIVPAKKPNEGQGKEEERLHRLTMARPLKGEYRLLCAHSEVTADSPIHDLRVGSAKSRRS